MSQNVRAERRTGGRSVRRVVGKHRTTLGLTCTKSTESAGRQLAGADRVQRFLTGERTPVDLAWASRSTSSAYTALPAGVGRQDPAEQVQVKDKGDDEYQAPPASHSRGAEHNDDDGDPN